MNLKRNYIKALKECAKQDGYYFNQTHDISKKE